MNDGLVTVRLWGVLGEEFGHEHHFAIGTPLEAIAALDCNYPGFRRALVRHDRYYVCADQDLRNADSVKFPVSREVDIVPAVEGQWLVVPAIVAALGFTAGTTAFTVATIVTGVLLSALLVGVSLLLTPKPKKALNGSDERKESNAFGGPDNIVGQGASIPIIYGRCFVGSVVVAIGIETSDVAIDNTVTQV